MPAGGTAVLCRGRRHRDRVPSIERESVCAEAKRCSYCSQGYLSLSARSDVIRPGSNGDLTWERFEIAPPFVEISVIEDNSIHRVAFPCRPMSGGWINANSGEHLASRHIGVSGLDSSFHLQNHWRAFEEELPFRTLDGTVGYSPSGREK